MKTRITEAFGIRYPIILSGMSWISLPKMVAAVSNAGGLGILATGVYNPERTRQAIRAIRQLTVKPVGANATLYFPGAKDNARVLLDEKVPVINFSMGKGDWIAKAAHEYGGKVVASVVTEKHARSARPWSRGRAPRRPCPRRASKGSCSAPWASCASSPGSCARGRGWRRASTGDSRSVRPCPAPIFGGCSSPSARSPSSAPATSPSPSRWPAATRPPCSPPATR
ncbi:MAG: nitronate monooxygenase [Deltaproteobacteria bacterium]|nr:nitronate monooxygenase [Deltaproteobacteria bacterium]